MTLGDRVAVLRKGVLQQMATPRELYQEPANLFVAGFIGSPPMNFIPATVSDGQLRTPFGTVTIPEQRAPRLDKQEVVLIGARPEDFDEAAHVDAPKREHGLVFQVTIDVIEWLGNEQYAYVPFEAPDEIARRLTDLGRELDMEAVRTQLVVSLDTASRLAEGETTSLWLDLTKVHVFDPATGENLTLAESAVAKPAGQS